MHRKTGTRTFSVCGTPNRAHDLLALALHLLAHRIWPVHSGLKQFAITAVCGLDKCAQSASAIHWGCLYEERDGLVTAVC